jgi:hypothetical protein
MQVVFTAWTDEIKKLNSWWVENLFLTRFSTQKYLWKVYL